jgi:hypothetical protein
MDHDPIRSYLDAITRLDEAKAKVDNLRYLVEQTGQNLRHPYLFIVSNAGVSFPSEVAMSKVPTMNASDWPSARQIAEALASLHTAHDKARNAFYALSESDRKNVAPLPERD